MHKYRHIILYGISLALLLFLLKWLQFRLVIIDHALEIYIGIIALLFTGLGIWVALKLARPKVEKIIVEKPVYIERRDVFIRNEQALAMLNLSRRELDVLELMAQGLTNQEIAGRLYVSLNTIKTHSMNLFEKMDVSRRTQAIAKGRELSIIP
ncbi:MAG: helix-turn-helix transcriptional regulator [Citrobacter freundii]|nr:MAG: helix-turn-helix transcriptional regulator [Citrobacter freundii]